MNKERTMSKMGERLNNGEWLLSDKKSHMYFENPEQVANTLACMQYILKGLNDEYGNLGLADYLPDEYETPDDFMGLLDVIDDQEMTDIIEQFVYTLRKYVRF